MCCSPEPSSSWSLAIASAKIWRPLSPIRPAGRALAIKALDFAIKSIKIAKSTRRIQHWRAAMKTEPMPDNSYCPRTITLFTWLIMLSRLNIKNLITHSDFRPITPTVLFFWMERSNTSRAIFRQVGTKNKKTVIVIDFYLGKTLINHLHWSWSIVSKNTFASCDIERRKKSWINWWLLIDQLID